MFYFSQSRILKQDIDSDKLLLTVFIILQSLSVKQNGTGNSAYSGHV